ncbi:hypothetical protein JX265_007851 [Neoarthrinium moseri]|uniref:Uncharacterized protein n=1 Tax=Neoarthrinium moseri TaxID=1658444 RepID=A0A9P9WJH3_9PEZI|nr:hypothetical protein JX266_009602 [Neoarthrinium moseri]KAI1866550.1 hypothetical protein JX265_007851 [Neoarthrinium moseri]
MQLSFVVALLPVLAVATPAIQERDVKKCCYELEGHPEVYYEITIDGDYKDSLNLCNLYYIRDTSDPDNCDAASRVATSGYCLSDVAFPVVDCKA